MSFDAIVRIVAFLIVGVVGLTLGLLWAFQEKLVFYPALNGLRLPEMNPRPYQNPSQMGINYEDVYIETEDKVKLHCWLMKSAFGKGWESQPTVIFFQGNAGNMGLRMDFFKQMLSHCPVNFLSVSYRGFGNSGGKISEEGISKDSEAVLYWLEKRLPRSKIYLFGRSIGGAVAIELAARHPDKVSGIIVENTFTSMGDMALAVFPFLRIIGKIGLSIFQRLRFDSLSKVPRVTCPILFISGRQDTLVPPRHMDTLKEAAVNSKQVEWIGVRDGTHNDTWMKLNRQEINKLCQFFT